MTTATLTLTDFLLARIAEDESRADLIASASFHAVTRGRILAECEAKRRIVEEHCLITDPARLVKVWRDPTPGVACERCANDPLGDGPLEDIGPCDTLFALASVYSGHPDYNPDWA